MSDPKTVPTGADVTAYLAGIENEVRRRDAEALCALMKKATGEPPMMWGPSIVGFGKLHYKYESGREGDTVVVGFSARKQALTLYGLKFYDWQANDLERLGRYTTGKGCVYIKTLADVDTKVLAELIADAYGQRSQ